MIQVLCIVAVGIILKIPIHVILQYNKAEPFIIYHTHISQFIHHTAEQFHNLCTLSDFFLFHKLSILHTLNRLLLFSLISVLPLRYAFSDFPCICGYILLFLPFVLSVFRALQFLPQSILFNMPLPLQYESKLCIWSGVIANAPFN